MARRRGLAVTVDRQVLLLRMTIRDGMADRNRWDLSDREKSFIRADIRDAISRLRYISKVNARKAEGALTGC